MTRRNPYEIQVNTKPTYLKRRQSHRLSVVIPMRFRSIQSLYGMLSSVLIELRSRNPYEIQVNTKTCLKLCESSAMFY